MNIHMAVVAAALYFGGAGKDDLQGRDFAMLNQACNLRVSDAPIDMRGARLTLRICVYGPMELIGPPPCEKVRFFILESEPGRRYERFMKRHEDNKEYVTFYRVTIDGSAYFDPDSNFLRINISDMSCWTRIPDDDVHE